MYKGFHHELGTRLAINGLSELTLTNKVTLPSEPHPPRPLSTPFGAGSAVWCHIRGSDGFIDDQVSIKRDLKMASYL